MAGKQHGVGTFVKTTGKEKRGRWENGKRVAWLADENDGGAEGGEGEGRLVNG